MKINFLTIFPRYFEAFKTESIISKAINKKIVNIEIIDFRNFTDDKHKKVDDQVYGGGAGMLLKIQPIDDALQSLQEKGKVILVSPQGKVFNQEKAKELSQEKAITFICGRYEGFDERIRSLVDEEISIGDYVLTGGEIPAMAISDSIIRLVDGVINKESVENDSFQNNLLDYPHFTRPREYKGMKVPEVLMNGNHLEIKKWREENSYNNTIKKRPDLLKTK